MRSLRALCLGPDFPSIVWTGLRPQAMLGPGPGSQGESGSR